MQIEVVTLRRLQITLLEGFSMPSAIALGHIHVVHMDRHPHIRRRIGDLIIDVRIDKEVICLGIAVLDIIDTGLLHRREVELHIIIFKIRPPRLHITFESFCRRTVGINTHQRGRR